ncbi:Nn.00g029760.m01.CDS01 [Neocucurbitaria sp. VM-36]
MFLAEKDQDVFKRWILPKLETISDADAGVLADYVIALVVTKDSEANIKRNCLESLSDFLRDDSEPFVDEVLKAIKDRSYIRASTTAIATTTPQTAPIPSIVGTSNADYEPHTLRATNTPPPSAPKGPATTGTANALHRLHDRPIGPSLSRDTQQARKRKLVEREASPSRQGQDPHYSRVGGDRPLKQTMRTGGRNTRGGAPAVHHGFSGLSVLPDLSNLPPHFPPPPPGDPPFDPANPMAFFMMMASLGSGLPAMPPPSFPNSQGNGLNQQPRKARCQEYYTKGICALGTFCPYEHVGAITIPADQVPEYDPEHASLALPPDSETDGLGTHCSGARSHTRGGIQASRPRKYFSAPGAPPDRSITTLGVARIPEDKFSEDGVRAFFSQFGTILEVKMHAYKRLAVVKFENRDAAERAYNNPKAVFDNRFVKVYWHISDYVPGVSKGNFGNSEMVGAKDEQEEKIDLDEVAKRQAEAQKAFEERREKAERISATSEEVSKKLRKTDEEIKKMKHQLTVLSGDRFERDHSQPLDNLQAAAEDLFTTIDGLGESRDRGGGTFHMGYRGRGYAPFPPRGRGSAPFRGGYRGRGLPTPSGRSSVRRLDNRPRRLVVAAIEAESSRDEALRQYLINVPDCTSIERHPEETNSLILTFKERYQAEMFLDESRSIPDVGILDLSWIPNDAFGGIVSTSTTSTSNNVELGGNGQGSDNGEFSSDDDDSSATVGEQDNKDAVETDQQPAHFADADMDVADDVDQWL